MLQNLYSVIYQKQFISHKMSSEKHSRYIKRITPESRNEEIKRLKKISNMALDEAHKMLAMPMNQIPLPALEYLKYLTNSTGINTEVCLTAYAYYNQALKNMPCSDEQYKITQVALQWFIAAGYVVELTCMECGDTWMGGEPARCCSGRDCGCMGQPIDPVVCSKECYDKVINKYK